MKKIIFFVIICSMMTFVCIWYGSSVTIHEIINNMKFEGKYIKNAKGKLVKNGTWIAKDSDGKVLSIINFKNDKYDGKMISYNSVTRDIDNISNWKDGKKHGKETGYIFGKKVIEMNYKDGIEDGLRTLFIYDEDTNSIEEYVKIVVKDNVVQQPLPKTKVKKKISLSGK